MEYRKGAHCVFYTRYHLVFVTKYRRKVLKRGMGAYLKGIMIKSLRRSYPEVEIIEVNTDEDHIHILCSIPPSLSISQTVQYIKGYSAHAMGKRFPFLKNVYHKANVGFWSDGFFASTVGINEETIRKYIEHQGEEDSSQAKLEL